MTVLGSLLRPVLRSSLYSQLVGKWGGAFSPSDLFQTGDILLWYDPSDLSTMFKDTAGTQPVTADGDSVALMLDKGQWGGKTLAQVLAAQPELVSNTGGPYVDTTGWVAGFSRVDGTISVSSGLLVMTRGASDGASSRFVLPMTGLTIGRRYEVVAGAVGGTGALAALSISGNSAGTGALVALYSAGSRFFVATATTMYAVLGHSGSVGQTATLASASVKEVPGYHRIQATGTSMPKYKTDGTLHWLLYDGTDDGHATETITWGTDEVAICAGVTKSSDAAAGAFAEFSANSSSNNGSFALLAPSAAADNLFWRSKGTAAADNTPTGFVAPFTGVLTGTGKIASDTSTLRANGAVSATSATDQGTGNFGSYAMYFGRRGGTTLPFNGREYQTVIRSRLLSAAELASLETFVAEKTGVIL